MSNPKHSHPFFNKKRSFLLVAVLAVVALCIPTTTAAWLNDFDQSAENVFVKGHDLDISFNETVGDGQRLVPGDKIAKDPTVTVEAGSEPCYLFVKAKGNANAADFLDYMFDNGWTPYSEFITDGKLDPAYQTNNTFYFDSADDAYDNNLKAYFSQGGTELFTGTKDTNVKMWVGYDSSSVHVYFKMYTSHATSTVRFYYDPDPTASANSKFSDVVPLDDHGDVAFLVNHDLSVVGDVAAFTSDKAPYYNNNYFKEKNHLFPFEFSDSDGSGFGFEVRLPRKDDGSNTFKLNFAAENGTGADTGFAWTFGPQWWIQHSSMRTFDFNNNFVSQNYDGYYYRIVGDVEDGPLTADQTFYILEGLSGNDRNGTSMANGYVTCRSKKQNGSDIVASDLANPDVTLSFKAVAIQQQNLVLSKAFEVAKPQLDAN